MAAVDTRNPAIDTPREITTIVVPAMHCAGCMRTLENGLRRLPGVLSARANLSLKQVQVCFLGSEITPDELSREIGALGFDNHVGEEGAINSDRLNRQSRHLLLCLAVAGFASANIMLLSVSIWSGAEAETERLFALISGLIAVPAVFFAGSPFFKSAMNALAARQLNMDVPISLAVLLSLFMSIYEALIGGGETFFDASVMLLFFLLIGRTLDHLMREKAASGVKSLAGLIPRKVTLVGEDGVQRRIDLGDVQKGMMLRILPGDRFPVDGEIITGSSAVDRSIVTGETGEVPVTEGDTFEAGTLNLTSAIDIQAVSDAKSSFLSEVLTMMKAAETGKGRYRRIADRMAAIYAPAVHLLALATFLGWLVIFGDVKSSLTAAIAVLIITCPCALGLAVPVTHVIAANRLFSEGILMRDGSALERLAEADTVFFDKTGTLTEDTLRLDKEPDLAPDHEAVLKSLAQRSRHPVARTIARTFGHAQDAPLTDVTETAGFGLEARWNGKRIRLGRMDWARDIGTCKTFDEKASTGFAIENDAFYAFGLTSELKPDAVMAVKTLQADGLQTEIISGDRESNVRDIARKSGIERWNAGLSPKDKVARIEEVAAIRKVLMVGDGLNDAPSLAAAHVSMAPASATDVSRASADFVYTRTSLMAVPFAARLAKGASSIVRQNFTIAIVYNCIAVPLAMAGMITPLIAALCMSLSSIVVVSNSMRLSLFDGFAIRKDAEKQTKPRKRPPVNHAHGVTA